MRNNKLLAFSSADSPNANWYIAKEKQLYKKYGLDVELIYIPSSTTTVAAVVPVPSRSEIFPAGRRPTLAVGGANVVVVGCFINTPPLRTRSCTSSIRSAAATRGQEHRHSAGVGSSSDVAARVLLKELEARTG